MHNEGTALATRFCICLIQFMNKVQGSLKCGTAMILSVTY